MANTCFLDFTISGEKGQLEKLFQFVDGVIHEITPEPVRTNWLGNILFKAGIPCSQGMDLRDYVYDVRMEGDALLISAECSWHAHLEGWALLFAQYPGLDVIYAEEEVSMEIVRTNDPNIAGHFYVDSFEELFEPQFAISKKKTQELLAKLWDGSEPMPDDPLEAAAQLDTVSVHQWEYKEFPYNNLEKGGEV